MEFGDIVMCTSTYSMWVLLKVVLSEICKSMAVLPWRWIDKITEQSLHGIDKWSVESAIDYAVCLLIFNSDLSNGTEKATSICDIKAFANKNLFIMDMIEW